MTASRSACASWPLMALMVAGGIAWGQATPEPPFRLSIPETLPPHPRVFCTQTDLDRIRAEIAAGETYAVTVAQRYQYLAEATLATDHSAARTKPTPHHFSTARTLAEAYALTGDERYGRAAAAILDDIAVGYVTLETSRSRGRVGDNGTLSEGPLAVNAAMAYDLVAAGGLFTPEQDQRVRRDLLELMAWECGHKCTHVDSSNWRSWALTVVASCGFALGDRQLIEEAVNGVWDPQRQRYLYGFVQQASHSVFADGIHWERCAGYTYYTASALQYVIVPAVNAGIDLWHAEIPGILEPFQPVMQHTEYGPPGPRSIKAFLDVPFYYAFSGGKFMRYGDSGTGAIGYHPLYELAWKEYGDPNYAWLINRRRGEEPDAPGGWSLWRAAGEPTGTFTTEGRSGGGFRLTTGPRERVALVQDVAVPAGQDSRFSGWVKMLAGGGGSAHLRANWTDGTEAKVEFSQRVTTPGDWQQVELVVPAWAGAAPGATRRVRFHVFLETGAGDVIWDELSATTATDATNAILNPTLSASSHTGLPLDFWSLVHSPREVPPGEYDLTKDATIGLVGRHEAGHTLFPIGGFAVLRPDPTDPETPSVNFAFGPYGSGHDHPDRLHYSLHGLGQILMPDAGVWGYDNPMHLTWANQTIAHNTVTIDEVAQYPQGTSTSIWAAERGGKEAYGVLRRFHPGQEFAAVRATCDTVYDGVVLDRTLLTTRRYVLDVMRVTADSERLIDLPFHGQGSLTCSAPLATVAENPWTANGYKHLTALRQGTPPAGLLTATYALDDRRLNLLQIHPAGGELILAETPSRFEPRSVLIARRRGQETTYVTVLEPHRGEPATSGLTASEDATGLTVEVTGAAGVDRYRLDWSYDGTLRLERLGPAGQTVASEEAA